MAHRSGGCVDHPYPGSAASMTDTQAAVLFDVDGTLLDTNYLHVIAWWESFIAAGEQVSAFDIHRNIGRGSSDLVRELLGREDDDIVQGHSERWAPLRKQMIPFHDAAELMRECKRRGLRVVLATSGAPEDVEDFMTKLDADDAVHAIVNSGDVENSKPAPDIVVAALEAGGVSADHAVLVGDTVYDIRAAKAAGVGTIGLLGGGIGEQELRQDGPDAIFGNCAELLQGLDDSPIGKLLT